MAKNTARIKAKRGLDITPNDTGAVFRPLKTAESVARDIAHDIVSNNLETGDTLPTEAVMLEQYGVSRESLREGLRLLETQGFITIRRGPRGGPMVGTVDPANLGRVSTLYFHLLGATYDELFDTWLIAEQMIAERAARNPDDARRREAMAPYFENRNGRAPGELEEFVTRHTSFHGQLGMLTDNRVFALTMRTYGLIVSHHMAHVGDPRELAEVLTEDHTVIARAVAAGHANKARAEMEHHISRVLEDFRAHLGDRVNDYVEWL